MNWFVILLATLFATFNGSIAEFSSDMPADMKGNYLLVENMWEVETDFTILTLILVYILCHISLLSLSISYIHSYIHSLIRTDLVCRVDSDCWLATFLNLKTSTKFRTLLWYGRWTKTATCTSSIYFFRSGTCFLFQETKDPSTGCLQSNSKFDFTYFSHSLEFPLKQPTRKCHFWQHMVFFWTHFIHAQDHRVHCAFTA